MKRIVLTLTIFVLAGLVCRAQDIAAFLNAPNGYFKDLQELSDGSILVTGSAEDVNWVPAYASTSVLDTTGSGLMASPLKQARIPFIMQLNPTMDSVRAVVYLPAGIADNITAVKTTNVPGQPTGDMYFSGLHKDPVNNSHAYFIAKLNNNFVGGLPSGLVWAKAMECKSITTGNKSAFDGNSEHPDLAPWDVTTDGRVFAGFGGEFHFDMSGIEVLDANGQLGFYKGAALQYVTFSRPGDSFLDGKRIEYPGQIPQTGKLYLGTVTMKNGNKWNSPDTTFTLNDSVDYTISESRWILKNYRRGMPKSNNMADYNLSQPDENGNPGRLGKYPGDYIVPGPCVPLGDCPSGNIFTPGHYGYSSPNIYTAQIADVVIDKRNNDLYFAYNIPLSNPLGESYAKKPENEGSTDYNFETAILAYSAAGDLKWWATGYKLDSNSAHTFARDLEIDYANNQLYFLGRSWDYMYGTFWNADQITANPGGHGVQNSYATNNRDMYQSWIGAYDLSSGSITKATWLTEMDAQASPVAPYYTNPLTMHWPNRNANSYDGANTKATKIRIAPNGRVGVIGYSEGRTLTTINAYQHMPVAGYGMPTPNQFVRVYSAGLDSIIYSSLVTGNWDINTGMGGDNTVLSSLLFKDSLLITTGELLASGTPPVTKNAPNWATQAPIGTASQPLITTQSYLNPTPTGVNNTQQQLANNTLIYPNPASSVVFVQLPNTPLQGSVMLQITDLAGRLVANKLINNPAPGQLLQLNTASIAKGLYLLRLEANGQLATKKVVIE